MRFPMDIIDTGVLLGDRTGIPKNGATLTPGVDGAAFFVPHSGARFHFGTIGCLHSPSTCVSGMLFTMWVILYQMPATFIYMVHSGGCKKSATGFCLAMDNDYILFNVRHTYGGFGSRISLLSLNTWHFLAISYMEGKISFYNNGCLNRLFEKTAGQGVQI